jgi:hypothetical protein
MRRCSDLDCHQWLDSDQKWYCNTHNVKCAQSGCTSFAATDWPEYCTIHLGKCDTCGTQLQGPKYKRCDKCQKCSIDNCTARVDRFYPRGDLCKSHGKLICAQTACLAYKINPAWTNSKCVEHSDKCAQCADVLDFQLGCSHGLCANCQDIESARKLFQCEVCGCRMTLRKDNNFACVAGDPRNWAERKNHQPHGEVIEHLRYCPKDQYRVDNGSPII